MTYVVTDVRILEDDYIELFKAGDPTGLKVWTYAGDLVYLGKLTWDDVAKFANDVKDVERLAFEFNGNVYFFDDEIASILNSVNLAVDKVASILNSANLAADKAASILNSVNLAVDKVASILNNANLAADRVASIADSTNITSSRIKEILDTGVFTDADKIAALLDGVITTDDAVAVVNSGIYSDDLLAFAFNSTYLAADKAASILNSANLAVDKAVSILNSANLAVDKAASILNSANITADRVASILNSANITVQRASSIISNGNLSGTKLIDILISSNLNKDRAASILEGSTRFVRYSFEPGENWTLGETGSNIPAQITTGTGYVTHGSQAFANGSRGPMGDCNYAYAYINTNVANVVGVFYDVVPGNNNYRQRSEIRINDTKVFMSTNHVRNLRFKLSSPTTVTKLEVRSHKIWGGEGLWPGVISIDNIRLVI